MFPHPDLPVFDLGTLMCRVIDHLADTMSADTRRRLDSRQTTLPTDEVEIGREEDRDGPQA
jgi:hypothetical protein